ncbi:putative RNA methyltransferase [Nakamurella deserti]|uniref:putative RNA methyltransferase n=1 Tax=Nakamurella deserti TaxID=2164074 RepID=UPI000DBE92AC|nr:methyltransferase domain-containing protein [Nakamurella deserti]
MIDPVLPALACPHCDGPLTRTDGTLGCPQGHRFDLARQGYVSLLGRRSRTDTGDSAEMVTARDAFLAAGHYRPTADAVTALCPADAQVLLEVGAGTGWYLAAVLAARPGAVGIALDASVRAARRAASASPAIGSVVADAWSRLPVADGAVDVALSIFAPRDAAELSRVLRPDGRLIVVTPAPAHLAELIGPLGMLTVDAGKDAKLAASLAGEFVADGSTDVRSPLRLDRDDLRRLVLMGPSARHVDRESLDRTLAAGPDVTVATLAVTVSRWRRR